MANNVTTKLEELNLVDRFLFDETMESPEAYQAMVSILLEREIELLNKPETEKEFRVSPQLRQIRLDVVGMDKEKTIYHTEMQKRDTKNLEKRSRYYQAQMDVSLLEPGSVDFTKLNDTCFILVAPFDIFGRGLYRYTFEGTCRECPDLKLNDGAIRVFINTKGNNKEEFSQEFLDFMNYITETTDEVASATNSKRIKQIHNRVRQVRLSEKMGVKYMQRWEEVVYAKQDGMTEGKEKLLIKQVCIKLKKNKSVQAIADELEEDLDKVSRICEAASEYAPDYEEEKIYSRMHMRDNDSDKF